MSYTYDKSGNIETVSGKNGLLFRYTYDGLNQLIHEENYQQSKRYSYTYDCGGNITERKTYQLVSGIVSELLSTDTYEYETAWKDQLKSYNGQPITYDYAGNPLQYKGNELEWDRVRKLVKYGNHTFAYDADGIRYQKNNITYTLDGSNIVKETDGVRTLIYYYGTNGVVGFRYNGNDYYYRKNLQGDVIEIYRADGVLVAGYEYDAWGKILRVVEHNNSGIGAINPFRYRGYYYDVETELYYVKSRYYDPEIGRFISADTTDILTETFTGLTDKNLFAYCDNNPVVRVDNGGQFWESAFDVISLGASIVEVCINPTDIWAWAGLVGDAVDLVPFVTGVGEVTRAVKTTVKTVDKAADILDTANDLYKTVDAADDIKKATGSYEIIYKSGKNYVGKGNFKRAMTSAREHAENADDILSIRWKSAPTSRDAFIDEYLMQKRSGGVLSSNRELATHNKIWSPGRKYYVE